MIDYQIQQELRERFNPEGSKLRMTQLRMLEMLKFIDKVCNEHGIKYWLSSGTCLGAVRHGGFIPWDDDVDIEMMEDDYKHFIAVMNEKPSNDYVVQTPDNDPNYIFSFSKLRDLNSIIKECNNFDESFAYRGIYIDIFPMASSSSFLAHKLAGLLYWRGRADKDLNRCYSLKRLIFLHLYKVLKPLLIKLDGRQSIYIRHKLGSPFFKPRKKSDIFPLKYIKFEDTLLPVPNDYDSYLRGIYGTYEELPDLNNIKRHTLEVKLL